MNKERNFYLIVLFSFSILVIFASTNFAAAASFNRNLSIGASGDDVSLLQTILSKDLADQGISLPNTGYFGNLTKNAVIAFQNKYAAQTLAPAGLTVGTGFVGSLTRAQLNALQINTLQMNTGQTGVTQVYALPQLKETNGSKTPSAGSLPETVDPSKFDWSIFLKNGAKQSDIDKYKNFVISHQKTSAMYAAIQTEKQKNANTIVTLDSITVDGSDVSIKNPISWAQNTKVTVRGGGFSGKNPTVWSSSMGFVQTFSEKTDQTLTFTVQNFTLSSTTRQIQQYYKQPTLSTFMWVETDKGVSKKIVVPVVFDVQ